MADLSDAANWFETDASNNRPSPNGWAEGMLPSGVNDSARSDKGALKRFWDKVNPVQAITPASGVYTFTTSNIAYPAAYVEGEVYSFKPLAASIGGDSFQVNSLGGKPILKIVSGGTAPIAAQDIVALFAPRLVYNAALNAGAGAFVLLNPFVPVANNGAGGITLTGDVTAANLRATGNLYLGGNYVFYAGNTSGAIGPHAYADNTNFVTRLGSGNGGFYFENSAGTNVAEITNNGSLIAQGNIALGGNSINFAGSGAGGPEVYGDATNMFMQLGPSNGQFIWYSHAGATLMTLAGGGALTVNGTIAANGPNGMLQFVDRTGSPTWGWYATSNVARLWSSAVGDRVSVDSGGNLVATGNVTAGGWVYANVGHASKAGAGGGFTGNSFNIEWRPPTVHLWIDATDEGAIVLADGGGNVTVAGLLTVNVGGTAINAPNGDIRAGGSVFIGGTQLYNNGGWVYSPNGLRSSQILSDGSLTVTGTSNLGAVSTGALGVSGLLQTNYNGSGSGGVSIYATAGGIRSDVGGTALYLPNGDISCQNIVTAGSSAGGAGSNIGILCNNGAVQVSRSGTAFYAPNGDFVGQNITVSTQGFKPGGGSWAATSDARLKKNVKDYDRGLDAILALRPISYEYNGKAGTPKDGRRFVGLVADEVLPVMPEMVGVMTERLNPKDAKPTEIKTLNQTALTFALVNCVRELAARIVTLEAK